MEELAHELLMSDDTDEIIDEAMRQYGTEILQLVFSYVKNKEIAEDLTQDIFVKSYKAYHTYNHKSKFRTWLWRIAINHCKDYLKSWYNKNVIVSEEESVQSFSGENTVEQAVIQKDEDQYLITAIMDLPVKYREVIYLFYYEELPIKEISVLIGANENTVKTRLRKAKELLKEKLED